MDGKDSPSVLLGFAPLSKFAIDHNSISRRNEQIQMNL